MAHPKSKALTISNEFYCKDSRAAQILARCVAHRRVIKLDSLFYKVARTRLALLINLANILANHPKT